VLERLAELVDGSPDRPMPGLRAHRALVEALRTSERGDPDDEVGPHFEAAIADYDAWGSPVYAARAHAAYATWLLRRGRSEQAEPHLALARERYVALGATAWLDDLERARSRVVG
jgi:hypothetical protein